MIPSRGKDAKDQTAHAFAYPYLNEQDKADALNAGFELLSAGIGTPGLRDLPPAEISEEITGSLRLPGADDDLPLRRITLAIADGSRKTYENRIAMFSIGSNAARHMLQRKFESYDADPTMPVLRAELPGHVIAHGAFLTEIGGIAVTLQPCPASSTRIALTFADPGQAAHLTGTEPNYDAVALETALDMRCGAPICGALAYVAIWGALSKDGKTPLLQSAIAANSPHEKASTEEAIRLAHNITASDMKFEDFMAKMRGNRTARLAANHRLAQAGHALATPIAGRRIFRSTVGASPDMQDFKSRIHYQRKGAAS